LAIFSNDYCSSTTYIRQSSVVVLVLVVSRETEMDHSRMYIRLLDIAIELSGFLSDIKHPENLELVSFTVLQLDK